MSRVRFEKSGLSGPEGNKMQWLELEQMGRHGLEWKSLRHFLLERTDFEADNVFCGERG